jgi:aryl-alcohol dehydrogenase-like predicted oxidoreductase
VNVVGRGVVQTRKIGSLEVTVVGLGTNNFGLGTAADQVPPVVDAAIGQGINFFDTADSYGDSEERLGRALGRRRNDVLIATKFASPLRGQAGTGGARPEYVRTAVEASLKRLGTDRIDLYQVHRPDPETPIAETLGALAELVQAGKVREIGCSNFSAKQLRGAYEAAGDGPRFSSVQNQYNLLNRGDEAEVIPTCEELGIAYLPYFPLASGLLTGKYRRGEKPPEGTRLHRWGERAAGALTDEAFDKVDALGTWAGDHGHSLLDLAIAWLAARPVVASVIAGATKVEQVVANAGAAGWQLSASDVEEVDRLARDAA